MDKANVVIIKQQETPLSKEQKQFNRLNAQIAKQRNLLLNWQDGIANFKTLYSTDYQPLINKYDELRIKMAYLLNDVYDNKIFTKTDRKKMLYIICEIAQEFADDNVELKEIYNKRSGSNYDEEQEVEKDLAIEYIKTSAFQQFDIDLEGLESNNPEEYFTEFVQKMQEQLQNEHELKSKRKKSAKDIEKEAQKAAEEQNISQSIREVYRQLAKTLHPDRETDIIERERKTKLMQDVNAAYAKQDLITLLQMQLEVEQINQDAINSISVEKVKHYNAVLKRQLQELKQEIFFVYNSFLTEFDIPILGEPTPEAIITRLKYDIKGTKIQIKNLQHDLELWNNQQELKQYIKHLVLPKRTHNALLWME